jgi:hypothetical protein
MADEWDLAYDEVTAGSQTAAPPLAPAKTKTSLGNDDSDWDMAFDEVTTGAPTQAPSRTRQLPSQEPTEVPWHKEMWGRLTKGEMVSAQGLLRLPAHIVSRGKLLNQYVQAELIHAAKDDPDKQRRLLKDMKAMDEGYDNVMDEMNTGADWHQRGMERIIEHHPEWTATGPPENIKDLLTDPRKLTMAISESLPTMINAGILSAAGQPQLASALMYATESDQARKEALAAGESKDTAEDAAQVYGLVAGAIEQIQLGQTMKIAKGAYNAVLNRAAQKVTKKGVKSITKQILMNGVAEAVEEMVQGTWGEVTAKTVYDKPILDGGGVKGFLDRRAQEAYVAFVMGSVPGLGGAVVGKITGRLGPDTGVTMEPDAPRRPAGKDASPEELQRDIANLEKGTMRHYLSPILGLDAGMDTVLDQMAGVTKGRSRAARRAGGRAIARTKEMIADTVANSRQQMAGVSNHIRANPNTFIEGNKLLDHMEETLDLLESFSENPSRETQKQVQSNLKKMGALGEAHMRYFEDLVQTLRKHPGYEGTEVLLPDASGVNHPVSPLPPGVTNQTMEDLARREEKTAVKEAQKPIEGPPAPVVGPQRKDGAEPAAGFVAAATGKETTPPSEPPREFVGPPSPPDPMMQPMIGDILTEVKELPEGKFGTPVTDLASLKKVGKQMLEYYGVKGDVKWVWSNRGGKRQYGSHRVLSRKKDLHSITLNIKAHDPKVNARNVSFDKSMKLTMIHEIGHIVKPPTRTGPTPKFPSNASITKHPTRRNRYTVELPSDVRAGPRTFIVEGYSVEDAKETYEDYLARELGGRRSVHHKEFKKWDKAKRKEFFEQIVPRGVNTGKVLEIKKDGSVEFSERPKEEAPSDGAPYVIIETQTGVQVRDRHGRIMEHFDNYDPKAGEKAVKLHRSLTTNPKVAAKYDQATIGQKARITLLGKRMGYFDEKGKPKPAFRRFIKGLTGKTVRSKLTYGEAQTLIVAMGKHQPTFRRGDKVTPEGFDVVGEVIHINPKRGVATVQFKDKTTGATSSKIFNMAELSFLGDVQLATEEMTETIRLSQKLATPKDEVLGQRENRQLKKYWKKVKRQVTGWHLGQVRVARMLEWLDGHTKGANWNRIFLPMNTASMEADEAINMRLGDLQQFMTETLGPEGIKTILTAKKTPVADPRYADKIQLSPAERIGYYVLTKNQDGLRRLKQGNLGSFGNSEQALAAVLESVTPEEMQIGDWALQQLQERYPDANQAALIALGRELTPADNYFPLYSPADSVDFNQQIDALTTLEETVGIPKTSMEISEAQERVPTSTSPVEADFFRSYLHNIARVERFINMAPAVNEVQNLLNNREYRHTLNKATDGYGMKILQHWMTDTTKGKSSEVNDWTGKLLTGLRRNAMVYAIGFNIPSVIRQTLSMGNAMAIDPLMMKHLPQNWMKNKTGWDNYRTMENEVMRRSLMMRTRSFDRVESILNSVSATQKRMLGKKEYSQKALGFIRWMDRHTTVLAWSSLYNVATDRGMSEEQAAAFADDGISKTQPMGNARDLPDFFRGGPLQKLLTTFQNQVNQNYNFWTHDIAGELKAGKISKKTAAYRVMFSHVIPALLFGMVGRGGPPESWKDVGKDLALYPLGSLFLVGRVIYNAAQGFAGGGTSVAEIGVTELEKTVAAGFEGDVAGVVKHGIKATGALTGRIPAQAIRTAEGAYDLSQNETDDWRRLIYSEWALSRGDTGTEPVGRTRKLRKRRGGPRKRKLRRR